MSKRRKRILVFASLAVLAVAVVTGGLLRWRASADTEPGAKRAARPPAPPPAPPTRFEAAPRVIARIGAVEITKEDLRGVLDTDEPAGGPAGEGDDGFYETSLWLAAKSEVMNRVLVAEARRRGLSLTSDELAEIELPPGQRAQLDQVAPQFGMTGAELVRRREEMRLVEKLVVSEIYDQVEVTEDEIVAVYERETSGYFRPDTFRARRILLRPGRDETDGDLLARAQRMAKELGAKGADFAATARKVSDSAERGQGGLMPDFTLQQPPTRDPEFLATVMRLDPGEVSRPLRMGDGYQILKLEERLPRRRMTLAEARPLIVKHLQWSKGGPRALAWAEELERQAGAEILVPMPADVARSREALFGNGP